jgi:hypothetical protein
VGETRTTTLSIAGPLLLPGRRRYFSVMRVWGGIVVGVVAIALIPHSAAQPSSLVIQGDYKIGGYAVKANGTLDGALKAFGEPTSIRSGAYRGRPSVTCVVRWRRLGLRIRRAKRWWFAN